MKPRDDGHVLQLLDYCNGSPYLTCAKCGMWGHAACWGSVKPCRGRPPAIDLEDMQEYWDNIRAEDRDLGRGASDA